MSPLQVLRIAAGIGIVEDGFLVGQLGGQSLAELLRLPSGELRSALERNRGARA